MIISKDMKTIKFKNICKHNKIFSKAIIEKNVVWENDSFYLPSEMIHKNEKETTSYFIENKIDNVINLLSRLSVYSMNNESKLEEKNNHYMQNNLIKQIKKELSLISTSKSEDNILDFNELNTLINNQQSLATEETINNIISKINNQKKNKMFQK